jgi:pimeloyl-ACP methyl ester carboxylesterase
LVRCSEGLIFAPYASFGGSPADRSAAFFDAAFADPAVVADEARLAQPAPSGEIVSVLGRPSGAFMGGIRCPVLLLLAERDALFPPADGPVELTLFTSAPDRQLVIAPEAGPVLFLHRRWHDAVNQIIVWLRHHPSELPAC